MRCTLRQKIASRFGNLARSIYTAGMIILLRMLMVILMLGPISAPAAFALPAAAMQMDHAVEQPPQTEAQADDPHACCPSEQAVSSAVQTLTELAPTHMDCDNSCSDCQHFCHASSAGLLTASRVTNPNTSPERTPFGVAAAHFSTTPLERPPHHS